MATVKELFEQGYDRVRLPQWNATAYLQLQVVEQDGRRAYGPMALLHDPPVLKDESMDVPLWECSGGGWEGIAKQEA